MRAWRRRCVPNCIVRFGGPPTSTAVDDVDRASRLRGLWLVDPAARIPRSAHRASRVLPRDPATLLRARSAIGRDAGRGRARVAFAMADSADRAARSAVADAIAADARFLTPQLAARSGTRCPSGAALFVANSMADPRRRFVRRPAPGAAAAAREPRRERHRRARRPRRSALPRRSARPPCSGAATLRCCTTSRACSPGAAGRGSHDRREQRRRRRNLRVPAGRPDAAATGVRAHVRGAPRPRSREPRARLGWQATRVDSAPGVRRGVARAHSPAAGTSSRCRWTAR